MMRLAKCILAAIMLFGVTGCREENKGDPYALDGRLVEFNYRVATARFLVNLKTMHDGRDGDTAIASFEDPAGGQDIEVREKIWPAIGKTTFITPPLRCIVKDRPYKVHIQIMDSSGKQVQLIDTSVVSSEDQTLLPEKPLVSGPLYTPNPDMQGHSIEDQVKAAQAGCPQH